MKKNPLPKSSRGSALAVAILFTMVCALLAFSVLRWSATERRLNARGALWLAARNAAEGVAEYGFSQVRNDFETKSTPGSYQPGTANALNLPNASVFAGSNVVTGALSQTNPNGMELIASKVKLVPSSGSVYLVDSNDYNNQFDPLKGKWVYRQDIIVLARATVVPPTGLPITHYVTETISVRGAPLYAHAIFYSGDLEIHPGPQMDIYGPVHSNGSIFVSNQSDANGLNFHSAVTCAGSIFHAWLSSVASAQGSGSETLGQNPVTFINLAGAQVNMKAGTANTTWKDSTMGNDNTISGGVPGPPATGVYSYVAANNTAFRQYAKSTWGGNLLTGACGIMPYNPVSFNQVIDAAGDHPDPYVMIDVPNPPATTDPYYAPKMEVEAQKKSMQAGLYIKVVVDASGNATYFLYGPANSAPTGTPTAQIGPNGGLLLTQPTNMNYTAPNPGASPAATTPPLVTYIPFRRLKKVVTKSGSTYTSTYTVLKPDGSTDTTRTVATTTAGSGTTGTTYSIYSDSWTGSSFGYGMYDQRRGLATGSTTVATPNVYGQIDLVQIDMRAVTALVTAMMNNTNNANAITYTDPISHTVKVWNNANAVASGIIPATQTVGAEKTPWNGAIYVDILAPNDGTPQQTTSVRLVNGTVASGSSMIPSPTGTNTGYGPSGIGLSISTNCPLYILGHFNADGVIGTNAATTPDDGGTGLSGATSKESPTALAADCITILSPGWSDVNSLTLKPTAPNDVEIAAAFLVGLVPTSNTSGGVSSGGAHNLPRFVEDWSGRTVSIRGSLVTMFNCKVGTQPWTTQYYGAPIRKWGFDVLFQNGVYPPFTPKVMSYRRIDYTDLTATQYAAKKASSDFTWP